MGTWIEIKLGIIFKHTLQVVPYVGTWIEMCQFKIEYIQKKVVPYVGTWIEIRRCIPDRPQEVPGRSLRGNVDRNCLIGARGDYRIKVVPYVGTWIEICSAHRCSGRSSVVPYVGTWIEILKSWH